MRNVLEYKESYGEGYPSITSLPTRALDGEIKEKLFAYMTDRNFLEWAGFGECLISPFSHEQIPALGNTYTDGAWRWCDDLPIYMRDNDVALPDDFVQHVLESYNLVSNR